MQEVGHRPTAGRCEDGQRLETFFPKQFKSLRAGLQSGFKRLMKMRNGFEILIQWRPTADWPQKLLGLHHTHLPLRGGRTTVSTQPSAGAVTVLVVDDQEIVCMFVLAALQQRGYRTICALSGQDGLRCFSSHQGQIDLVVSDILMPDLSGYKMVEGIRAIRPDVPVLFITGTDQDIPLWAKRTCEVLRKPFSIDAFNAAVDECLSPRPLGERAVCGNA